MYNQLAYYTKVAITEVGQLWLGVRTELLQIPYTLVMVNRDSPGLG
jgi:hypothetical protein